MTDPTEAVASAIRDFPFDNYGLDDVDPTDENAEWVEDLAAAIVDHLLENP